MKKISISIPAFSGNLSKHTLYENTNSHKLAVLFPGQNNSFEIPTMYYTRKLVLSMNYDVLCLSINELKKESSSFIENLKIISDEINKALIKYTTKKDYSEIIFISRSLGNIISGYFRENNNTPVSKQIYIVPIKSSFEYIEKFGGLVISGTNDPHYSPDEMKNLRGKNNTKILLIEGGDHSLESKTDVLQDVENISKLIIIMKDYLK